MEQRTEAAASNYIRHDDETEENVEKFQQWQEKKAKKTPLEMMKEGQFVKCAAPMVRYSKYERKY
jgi:hypothetical protein